MTATTTLNQQSNKDMMSKSISSLSFCTQSSTSLTSSSADEISRNSNDLNETANINHSNETMQLLSHHHHHHHYRHRKSTSDDSLSLSIRRRRKRTIFSAADIEHLKEAFIQNPKPSRKYYDYILLGVYRIKFPLYSRARYCYSI